MKCDCIEKESYRIRKDGTIKEAVRSPGQCPSTFVIGNLILKCNWCQSDHDGQHLATVFKGNTRVEIAWSNHKRMRRSSVSK